MSLRSPLFFAFDAQSSDLQRVHFPPPIPICSPSPSVYWIHLSGCGFGTSRTSIFETLVDGGEGFVGSKVEGAGIEEQERVLPIG